jgi:hypothetical protein
MGSNAPTLRATRGVSSRCARERVAHRLLDIVTMTNHSDPMSTIDHDTLDDVTGACAPACTAAKPGGYQPQPQLPQLPQQQQGMPQSFDFRSWLSSFMRRFRY